MRLDALFRPFSIGRLTLPNRIVMAPMTRNFSPDGVPGDDVAAYYRRRAEHGVGLIVTEGTVIDHQASTDSLRVPRFFGEAALAGWRRVVETVHEAGGRIMPQIWHVGMRRAPGTGPHQRGGRADRGSAFRRRNQRHRRRLWPRCRRRGAPWF